MAPSVYSKVPLGDIEAEKYDDVVFEDEEKHSSFTKPLLCTAEKQEQQQDGQGPVRRVRRFSCCMTCCLITAVVLALLAAVAVGFAVAGYMWMANQVERWSVDTPNQDIPTISVPYPELQLFKDRAALFFDSIQGADAVDKIDDLTVTARALNGLAGSSDYLRGNLFATMTPNQVVVDVSLPLEGFPGGKGRFLVGTETMTWDPVTNTFHDRFVPRASDANDLPQPAYWDATFSLTATKDDGEASRKYDLQILSGQFFEWTVPQDFIDQHENLLDGFYHCECDDEDCKAFRRVLESMTNIQFEKDQVVLQAEPVTRHGGGGSMSMHSNGKPHHDRHHGSHGLDSHHKDGHHHHHGGARRRHGRALRSVPNDAPPSSSSSSSGWKLKVARRLVGI